MSPKLLEVYPTRPCVGAEASLRAGTQEVPAKFPRGAPPEPQGQGEKVPEFRGPRGAARERAPAGGGSACLARGHRGRDPGDAPPAVAAMGKPSAHGVAGRTGPGARRLWIPGARRRRRGPRPGFTQPRGLGFPVCEPEGDPRLQPRESAWSHEARCARGALPVPGSCRERAGDWDGRWSWERGGAGPRAASLASPAKRRGGPETREPPEAGFQNPRRRALLAGESAPSRARGRIPAFGSLPGPPWPGRDREAPDWASGWAGRAHRARHAAPGGEEGGGSGAGRAGAVLRRLLLLGLLLLSFLRLSRCAARLLLLPPPGARGDV